MPDNDDTDKKCGTSKANRPRDDTEHRRYSECEADQEAREWRSTHAHKNILAARKQRAEEGPQRSGHSKKKDSQVPTYEDTYVEDYGQSRNRVLIRVPTYDNTYVEEKGRGEKSSPKLSTENRTSINQATTQQQQKQHQKKE